jgi:tetratricopeptide (TPR) repeat protein
MDLSYIAIDRMVSEGNQHRFPDLKKKRRVGRVCLKDARQLADEALIEKLAQFDIALNKEILSELIKEHDSAESVADHFFEEHSIDDQSRDSDWVWLATCVLWERWFKDKPSFEMLDDMMMEGYRYWEDRKAEDHETKATDAWLRFWSHLKPIIHTKKGAIDEFDDTFRGSGFISNWFNDFRDALFNSGVDDKKYIPILMKYCEDWIALLTGDDSLSLENCRRTIAECHSLLGEHEKAESLYKEWINHDPQWGWGWIGWSDTYHFISKDCIDLSKAEELLRKGIAIEGVRDRSDIYDRLIDLLFEQKRDAEAEMIRKEAIKNDQDEGLALRFSPSEGNAESDEQNVTGYPYLREKDKVGRNDPCPCGSGKKYKKCCIN